MLKERFREVENWVFEEIKALYGERLVSVVLFGSAARETQRFDSDIDLLVIAKALPRGRMKRIAELEVVEDRLEPLFASLQEEGIHTYLSAVIKSPQEANEGSPLFLDMVEDARIIFDRGDFFSGLLDRLRKKLRDLGARRVWSGDAWYWDLKPDFQPGDVIEL